MNVLLNFFKILLLLSMFSCSGHRLYKISGELRGVKDKMIYLSNKELGINSAFNVVFHDSVFSEEGKFTFKGNYEASDFFAIEIPDQTKSWLPFIAPNRGEKVVISGHGDSLYLARITGNTQHDYFLDFKDSMRIKFDYSSVELYENQIAGWKDSLATINQERATYLFEYSKQSPDKFAIAYFTYSNFPVLTKNEITNIYQNLSGRIQQSNYGKMLFNHINSVNVGDQAYPFSLSDTLGGKVDLDDFRGHYVLLDFWASWCLPCLKELPELKEVYNALDKQKIKFLGISFDTKAYLWKNSIKENEIPWQNVSDLKGNKGPLIDRYQAISVPYKVLINPSGKIILSSSQLSDVKNKLKEIGLL